MCMNGNTVSNFIQVYKVERNDFNEFVENCDITAADS